MPTRFHIEFLNGTYDAMTSESGDPEWPPHPYRLFAALRAGIASLERAEPDQAAKALAALRRLETLPAPELEVPQSATVSSYRWLSFSPSLPADSTWDKRGKLIPVDTKVPSNKVLIPSATTMIDDRPVSTARAPLSKVSTRLTLPRMAVDVEGLHHEDIVALRAAAREIFYLGQATSPVVVTVWEAAEQQPLRGPTIRLRPGWPGRYMLGAWEPGLVDRLQLSFTTGVVLSGRVPTRAVSYRTGQANAAHWLVAEPQKALRYRDVWKAQQEVAVFLESFAPSVAGFTGDYWLLPNIGRRHSNGCLALAIGTGELSGVHRQELIGHLVQAGWLVLAEPKPWAQPWFWTGTHRHWVSATPMKLRAKTRAAAVTEIAQHLEALGKEVSVQVRNSPFVLGAERVSSARAWHAALEFAQPLECSEPLTIGPLGGLFLPIRERSVDTAGGYGG